MLRISEKAQEYLNESEEVREFNDTLVDTVEGYRKGVKMSLIKCLESILGGREGELKVGEEGSLILEDGKREYALVDFFCGFDYDCSARIKLLNTQANYSLEFFFPVDDAYISFCCIRRQSNPVTKERKMQGKEETVMNTENRKIGNAKFLQEIAAITEKLDWRGKMQVGVNSDNGSKTKPFSNRTKLSRLAKGIKDRL